jgi:hypothetical protein
VFPAFAHLSAAFFSELAKAWHQKLNTFSYKDTEFHPVYTPDGSQVESVRAILTGLDTPLPPVLTDELRVSHVMLSSSVPSRLPAKPGWYAGENFGLPGGACCIDPQGQTNMGTPQIYARGSNYDSVVALFRRVMAGGLEPGYNGDIWSGTIRR